jgi:hypothetical protein
VSNYDFAFPEVNVTRSPPKQRKNAKRPVKVKKSSSPRKKTLLKKPRALKERVKKQKKQSPTKSPRKYTRRVAKVPTTADIDDEEAAFILSSISQRSFDSFYSRQTSGGPNKIQIPLDGFTPSSTQNHSTTDPKNLAYYVMLDHNYWIVEPEVQPEVKPEVKPEVQPEVKPEIQLAVKEKPIEPVQNTITFSITQTIPEAELLQTEVQSNDKKEVKSEIVAPSDDVKTEDANTRIENPEEKHEEVNNNSCKVEDLVEKSIPKVESTAVKKRWLRQATLADASTPPKKRKTATIQKELDKISKKESGKSKKDITREADQSKVKVEVVEVKAEKAPSPKPEPAPTTAIENTKADKPKVEVEKVKKEESESPKLTSPPEVSKEASPARSAEIVKQEEVAKEVSKTKEAEKDEEEDDEKHWQSVMNFHRSQLELLQKLNTRFGDGGHQFAPEQNSSYSSQSNPLPTSRFNSNRQTYAHSRFSYFDKPENSDPRRSLSTSLSLDTQQHPDVTPFQRSISESSTTRKHRWSGNEVKTPFNSFNSNTSFFKENTHFMEEPYLKASYNSYRVQKSTWVNCHQDPLENNARIPHVGAPTNNFAIRTSLPFSTETTVRKFDPVSPDDSVFVKKNVTASIAIAKSKASAHDPRLNPSLNETRKEEITTPKKKVRRLTRSNLSAEL